MLYDGVDIYKMPKKSSSKNIKKRNIRRPAARSHGMDHDFILIAGGGFVLLILIILVLYR